MDESYFGGPWQESLGRRAAGKVSVFGLVKRRGRVYTKIISDASRRTLMPIIKSSKLALPIASLFTLLEGG